MKRELPPHVYKKGKKGYLYFERRGKTKRMPDLDNPTFWTEYAIAKRGVPDVPMGQNFKVLIARYKRSDRYTRLKPRTKQDYEKILLFVDQKLGGLNPARMQRKHVIQAQDDNRKTVRFANYIVQVLSVLFEHAIDIGWMERNPAKGVRLLKSESKPRLPWPVELVNDYRSKANGRSLLIFELCLGTGQRIGDVLRMRWNEIEGEGINVTQGKTGVQLWLPITQQLSLALDATRRTGLTIVSQPNGRPVSYRAAADAVMRVRREIGAEAYDLHALRHTTATELAALGCSDELIMAVTGHTSRASVIRYAGAARQRVRAIEAQRKRK